ncbi:MAG: hypothetical protein ACRD51_12625 [Candidatus Acidiferrum sp.]
MPDDEELKDLIAEEKQRGRKRPINIAARQRRMKLLNGFRITLKSGDESAFVQLLIDEIGLLPGTKEYNEALRKWRALRGTS